MNLKIFERDTLRQAIKDCLAEGYMPANTETLFKLREDGKVPNKGFDSGTLFINGVFRDATKAELENIDDLCAVGGRLVWSGSVGSLSYTDGNYDLSNNDGVLVGVKE